MALNSALLCGLVAIAIYTLRRILSLAGSRGGVRLPPGPPGLPIVGNVRPPIGPSWEVYRKWSEQYGKHIASRIVLLASSLYDRLQAPISSWSRH